MGSDKSPGPENVSTRLVVFTPSTKTVNTPPLEELTVRTIILGPVEGKNFSRYYNSVKIKLGSTGIVE